MCHAEQIKQQTLLGLKNQHSFCSLDVTKYHLLPSLAGCKAQLTNISMVRFKKRNMFTNPLINCSCAKRAKQNLWEIVNFP